MISFPSLLVGQVEEQEEPCHFECNNSLFHTANFTPLWKRATPQPWKTISLRHMSLTGSSGHLEAEQWVSIPLVQIQVHVQIHDDITLVHLWSSWNSMGFYCVAKLLIFLELSGKWSLKPRPLTPHLYTMWVKGWSPRDHSRYKTNVSLDLPIDYTAQSTHWDRISSNLRSPGCHLRWTS